MGERLNQPAIFRVTRDFGLSLSQTSWNTIKPGNPESVHIVNGSDKLFFVLHICMRRPMFDSFPLNHALWNTRGSNAGFDNEVPRPRGLVIPKGNLVVCEIPMFMFCYTHLTLWKYTM